MKPLTARQRQVLDFIATFSRSHGYPPTVREICKALKIASPSTVHFHLAALQDKGYLTREPGKSRTILVLKPT